MRALIEISTRKHFSKYAYLRKCLPRTYFVEYVVFISCCGSRRAPTGRYSCIAQGASPGLIISTHFLSSTGAALSHRTQRYNTKQMLALDTFTASTSKYLNYTKRKQGLHFLNSKPRRSLYRLRLKFVQTTRVVCTDYS